MSRKFKIDQIDPVLATTGSNTFIGDQIVTGSVFVTNEIFGSVFINPQTIVNSITIPSAYNALLIGPVSFATTVNIETTANLTII